MPKLYGWSPSSSSACSTPSGGTDRSPRPPRSCSYTQPSLSHHLSRLEAQTGARLLQRVGRGIRLTEAGRLLADRAAEIIGRVDSADRRALHAGRTERWPGQAGGLRVGDELAGAARRPGSSAGEHPGLELGLTDTHPEEALQLLRAGHIDVALIFRYDDTAPEEDGVRLPTCSTTRSTCSRPAAVTTLEEHRDSPWIAGCERCRSHLVEMCEQAGFSPLWPPPPTTWWSCRAWSPPAWASRPSPDWRCSAHRHPSITATRLAVPPRQIYAATYGDPPDPPATAALLNALAEAGKLIPAG